MDKMEPRGDEGSNDSKMKLGSSGSFGSATPTGGRSEHGSTMGNQQAMMANASARNTGFDVRRTEEGTGGDTMRESTCVRREFRAGTQQTWGRRCRA